MPTQSGTVVLERRKVQNAAGLYSAVRDLSQHSIGESYVTNQDGEYITEVLLIETTLSDGSKVRDIQLSNVQGQQATRPDWR